MASPYLKSFVIGSSFLVFLHFFASVAKLDPEIMNYTYQQYTFLAPFYLGLMNVLGGLVFGLQNPQRFWLTGLTSGILVGITATVLNSYNYSQERWYQYYFYIVMKHLFTFGILINLLEKLII